VTGAIFLDRDGVLIENREDYVKDWAEVEFLPCTFAAMRTLKATGLPIVLVTNQSAVGRGIITREFVEEVHDRMLAEVERNGGRIDAVYFCPHHPQEGCVCRKPSPGMLHQAARDLQLDLQASFFVGDTATDMEAAQAVGATGILVLTGKGATEAGKLAGSEMASLPIVADLEAAAHWIVERLESKRV